jgi:periplasmic protein TonB
VFDEVTKRRAGRRAAQRARYLLGSTAAQAAALAAAAFLCSGIHTRLAEPSMVPVKIVRSAGPIAGSPRPAPPQAGAERAAPARAPRARSERLSRPPPAPAVVQPERPAHEPEPIGSEAPEQESSPADTGERGGGDQGGGGGIGNAAGASSSSAGPSEGDAPTYPGEGWRRPQLAQRDCVQNSVRIPSGLRGFVQGPITAKFAIGPDGTPGSFQLIGSSADARIRGAIWQAIQSCKWIAGADAQGRPARLWVIMPIRFEAG